MKLILSLLLSMSILTSCQPIEHAFPADQMDGSAVVLRDVSYGKDTAQKMDIYLPEGRSSDSTRSIILIHGGGWSSGNKHEFVTYIDSFRKRMPDYAIFNLNYRLVNGENLFPTQELDIKAAIDFIAKSSAEYKISRDKLVLLGVSAGGHLALLHAYKYRDPRIRAVIDFFGPTDLTAMYRKPWHPYVTLALQMITGTTPDENAEQYRQWSPVNFVSSSSAPTLIFHGAQDQIVNISQSQALKKELEKANVKHEMVVYPGQRHGWYGKTLSNSFDRMEHFLKENVK